MSKRNLIGILILAVVAVGAFFVLRARETKVSAEKTEAEILKGLSADELNLVLKSHAAGDSPSVAGIGQTPESRKLFLNGLREYLTLAAQARREGMTEDPTFKINFEYKKKLLLADLYQSKLSADQGKEYRVPESQLAAVWIDLANEKRFATDMNTLLAIQKAVAVERGDQYTPGVLQGESLIKARANWARAEVLSDAAKADPAFMAQREIALRIKIMEAGILSADYLRKHWAESVRATDAEIAAFLATHPEYDLVKKHQKAESVLQRARAGEDFDKLAAEFSEDRTTKSKGGLYENLEPGEFWIEIENAALALNPGQIADRLIETHTGFHIVKLQAKKVATDTQGREKTTYSVKHILLQKSFEDPGNTNPEIPSPFLKPEEIAKAEIEKEKRNRFVANISRLNPIALPEDFTVDLAPGATVTLPKS